jgi:hypothetical protein
MHRGARKDMMIGRAPSPVLPDLRPALQLAGPVRPLVGVQGRGVARPARHEISVLRRINPRSQLDWAGRAVLAALILWVQNSVTARELGFYAARWYSLMRPPRALGA